MKNIEITKGQIEGKDHRGADQGVFVIPDRAS